MILKSKGMQAFVKDPFGFVDNLKLSYGPFNFNFFQKYKWFRKTILILSLVFLGCWIVFGFDSTLLQPLLTLYSLPAFFLGKLSLNDLTFIFNSAYGKDMHYSAFAIYGLMLYFLSRNFENLGIVKTKNVCYSAAIVFFSVGVFEFSWIYSFGFFQHLPWVTTWVMPQLKLLVQNTILLSVGALTIFYIYLDSYILDSAGKVLGRSFKFSLNKKALILIAASISIWLFWIYYPGYVQSVSVPLSDGSVWSNTKFFPQTLYTVKTDVSSSVNGGIWFWVPNDWIHLTNIVAKIIISFTIYYVGRVRKVEK